MARLIYCPASQRSPGAHRGLQGASGSRLTPPKKRHLSVLDVACLKDFFLFHVGGVLVSQSDNQRKMGRSETMRGSPSSGRSLPPAFRPGRCPIVRPAQGQILGVRVPGPGSRRSRSSIPGLGSGAHPSMPFAQAQPSPDWVGFRTLAAAAKDRRTPHHRLKIRPPARARTPGGGRALPRPGGGTGAGAQG